MFSKHSESCYKMLRTLKIRRMNNFLLTLKLVF